MKKQFYIALFALILATVFLYQRGEAIYVSAVVLPYNILNDINVYRVQQGLNVLQPSTLLCGLAYVRSQEIKTDWSHKQFQQEIDKIPVTGRFYENLSRGYEENEVVAGWKLSLMGHNEAMLVPSMKYGCVVASGKFYVFEGYIPANADDKIY